MWGARSHPQPRPRKRQKRRLPSLFPPPGRTSASASSPAPGAPRPLPGLAPSPHCRGSGCGCKRDPPPSPFSSIITSRSRPRSHGAPPAPLRPRRAPLESPGAGGGHRGEGTAPFPGIGSHDTVPYPKRAPSCTAFRRVRCFTSVLGLGGRGGYLSSPGDPRSCPPRHPGLEGASRGNAELHRVPFQPGCSVPTPGDKGWSERCCPHRGQVTFPGLVAFLGTASLAGSVPAAASPRSPGMHMPDPFPLPETPKNRDSLTWEPHRGVNRVGGGSPWQMPDHPQSSCSPRGTLGSQQLPQPQFRRFWTIWREVIILLLQ